MDMKFLWCIVLLCLMTAAVADFVDSDATCIILNGQCETRCTCNEGYTHMDEQCFAKVGTDCTTNADCVPDASCTGSTGSQTCQCWNSLVTSFNDTECRVKVDKECNSSMENVCIANAECKWVVGNDTVCKCRNKYSMYKNNSQCSGDVGAECEDSSDCTVHSECRAGTCVCMDKYMSSSDNKTCHGYVGAECNDISQCIEHAECSGGKCKCANDYKGDKICQKKDWKLIIIGSSFGGIVFIGTSGLCVCCCCRRTKK
ncbi:fibrillin-2-like isoform X1 [Mya arenaria]|nr:fibrillin-2-like isoform X1 [Mya arenaria]